MFFNKKDDFDERCTNYSGKSKNSSEEEINDCSENVKELEDSEELDVMYSYNVYFSNSDDVLRLNNVSDCGIEDEYDSGTSRDKKIIVFYSTDGDVISSFFLNSISEICATNVEEQDKLLNLENCKFDIYKDSSSTSTIFANYCEATDKGIEAYSEEDVLVYYNPSAIGFSKRN